MNVPYLARTVLIVLVLVLLAPTVIDYAEYRPAWDDTFFLHRAITLNNELWCGSLSGVHDCLRNTFKSPIIAFLALPWGPVVGGTAGPGILFFSLAAAEWLAVFLALWLLWRISVSYSALVLATACVALNPFVRSQAGVFLLDPLLSWIALCTILLVPLESLSGAGERPVSSFRRGSLWGLVLCVGLLCKATYLLFAGGVFPVLALLHWRRHGRHGLVQALFAAGIASLPGLIMWVSFGDSYLKHAVSSSYGDVSRLYASSDSSWWAFWPRLASASGWSVWLLVPFTCVAVWRAVVTRQSWPVFVPCAVMVAYLLLASISSNSELRLLLPVMIGMPYALAVLWRRVGESKVSPVIVGVAAAAMLLACVPETNRPRMESCETITRVLRQLKGDGRCRVVVATDSPYTLNVELVRLSKSMMGAEGRCMDVSTVVYDEVHKKELSVSLRKLDEADAVLLEDPLPQAPAFSNARAAEFVRHLQSTKRRLEADGHHGLLLFVAK